MIAPCRKIALILVSLSIVFTSCKDDDKDPEVLFTSRLWLGTEQIHTGDTLMLSNGYLFNLKKFQLYLCDINLISNAGDSVPLSEVELFNIGNSNSQLLRSIAEGNYTELSLGFGLSPRLNNSDPNTFSNNHPLSSWQQTYWSMLKYRFLIMEGRSNQSGVLGLPDDNLHAYHTGTDSLLRPVSFSINLKAELNQAHTIYLDIDLDKLFTTSPAIDLTNEKQTHSEPSDIHIAEKLMNNLAATAQITQ